jgi:SAM-dependent methyltransferase
MAPLAHFKKYAKKAFYSVPPNRIRFGSLRRLEPVSRVFGFDRGTPIDRYYMESFLDDESACICGHVLEIGDDSYSRKFGAGKITEQDVLHVVPGFPGATITADLSDAPDIPADTFDCIIFTNVLQYIFDAPAAITTLFRILKPGGTVLATMPGISRVLRDQKDKESDCWRFTEFSVRRLFAPRFGDNISISTYGNVLTALASLQGLASFELRKGEMDHRDPDYQVIVSVRAIKPDGRPCRNEAASAC